MGRKFAKITTEELRFKIESTMKANGTYDLIDTVQDDLKIQFNLENFETGLRESDCMGPYPLLGLHTWCNGFTFCGMCAGGDWEFPVFFIVYWDGKKLRAYVPTAGNPWNRRTKQAYGNDDAKDWADWKRQNPEAAKAYVEEEDGEEPYVGDVTTMVEFNTDEICRDIRERLGMR